MKTLSQESVIVHMYSTYIQATLPSLHVYYQESICQTTRYHIPEDHNFSIHCIETLKSQDTHAGSQLGQNIRVHNRITINCNIKVASNCFHCSFLGHTFP